MKILIIKFRFIGDVLLTTPLISNLKAHYPNASIHYAVNSGTQAPLQNNPQIEKIHIYERGIIKKANIFKKIYLELRYALGLKKEKFDIVINTEMSDRGLFLAKFIGAKTIVSPKGKNGILNKFITHISKPSGHIVMQNLSAINALNKEIKSTKVSLYFNEYNLNLPNNFIHIHPMARFNYKCVSDEIMAKIIDFCEIELDKRVVLTCDKSQNEIDKMKNILSLCKSKPIVFMGNLTLDQVAFLSSKSQLYIGTDTAIMHIAAANDVPCIALFGPSYTSAWGPWDNSKSKSYYKDTNGIQKMGKHTVIQSTLKCVPCGNEGCNGSQISDCLNTLDINWIKNEIKNSFIIQIQTN
ncbi:glycosyltransferase family 9 protein [Campylobacter porcelli]|uniref:Heptosyltransferase III n=1 Tax=Campylobacter porcelli TaxID=1660073 RepID=A0A1X9SXS2_9BACT|nr:glycosyltransferase family 9 protein [Campylobacter sp. RM6137]ARR01021.1 heptosyltransferase III [Campylobacter sp. RM6137]